MGNREKIAKPEVTRKCGDSGRSGLRRRKRSESPAAKKTRKAAGKAKMKM